MMSDPTSSYTTPDRPQAGPSVPKRAAPPSPTPPSRNLPRPPSPTPKGLGINVPIGDAEGAGSVSLQQALDHVASSAHQAPSGTSSGSHSQLGLGHPSTSPRTVSESTKDLTPSKRRELLRKKMASGDIETLESSVNEEEMTSPASSRGHSRDGSAASSNLHPMARGPVSEAGSRRSEDKGLPPLPHSAPLHTYSTNGSPYSSPRQSSMGTLMHPRTDGLLVSPNTTSGRIAQRRLSRQTFQTSISSMTEMGPGSATGSTAFPGQQAQLLGANLSPQQLTPTGRTRAKSQPGTRPDLFHDVSEPHSNLPPLPALPHKISAQFINRAPSHTNGLAPPHALGSVSSPHSITRSISSSLISPVPEPQPSELSHRPFHLLRILQTSMDPHGSGAYLTGSIHISPHVWQANLHTRPNQKRDPLRLVAQDTKVRCMEALIINLEIVRATGIPLLDGPRELRYGAPLTHIPHPKGGEGVVKWAEDFSQALDALEDEMDQTYKLMMKAGVQVNGWKGKKSSLVRSTRTTCC